MPNDAGSRRKAFLSLSTTVDSPEQLGVTLMQAIFSSALKTKITSEDGRKLVVPIGIAITPLTDPHARGDVEVEECHSSCWKVLGHNIICRKVCLRSLEADERHGGLSDATLRARVKSGPPLENSEDTDAVLTQGMLSASTASEAGILVSNALIRMLADGTAPINDDGSANIEAIASITVGKRQGTLSKKCASTTIQILGIDVLTYETCDTSSLTLS